MAYPLRRLGNIDERQLRRLEKHRTCRGKFNRTAHTLKGTSLNLGAAALGRLAKELEQAPSAAVLAQEDRLHDLLDRSLAALRARLPQSGPQNA